MIKPIKVIAIIPARGGSKRLPGKNVKLLAGKPMIAYAINAAKNSRFVSQTVVSTDDPQIAEAAKKYGAAIPFIRPAELASDTAKSIDVIEHCVNFLETNLGEKADIIVLIQPTSPLVLPQDVDAVIEKLTQTNSNSCATVVKVLQRPEWMYQINNDKTVPYLASDGTNLRGQDLPELFCLNGAVYAVKRNTLINDHLLIDNHSFSSVIMPRERSIDVDEIFDFDFAQSILKK